jgi:hypothetical protein
MKAIYGALCLWAMMGLRLVAAEADFAVADGWLQPPTEMETIGPAHGDVAVSANGDVYVSILSGPRPGIQVYSADGKYLRNVPGAPNDFHGFVIHRDPDGEHIYGGRLEGMEVLKMKLDGEVVLRIPVTSFPAALVNQQDGKPALRLTAVDVAPDGRIFAVDGYSTDRIHIFDATGKHESSLGGKDSPYEFKTNHKICIDTRFDPPRVLCCDRENRRVVTLSLDGKVLNVVQQMRRPAAVAVWGDLAAIAEIEGRVSLLDKEGRTVLTLGENTVKEQTATNQVKPADWRAGIFTAPHGVDFDQHGNVFVTEFIQFGRVVRYNRR